MYNRVVEYFSRFYFNDNIRTKIIKIFYILRQNMLLIKIRRKSPRNAENKGKQRFIIIKSQ